MNGVEVIRPRSARALFVAGSVSVTASVLYDLLFVTGYAVGPLGLIGGLGGFVGLVASIVVLTRTRDHPTAKRGAFLCALALLLVLPFALPAG